MPKATSANPPLTLSAFSAGSLALAAGGQNSTQPPPARLVIAPLGRHDARGRGPVIVDSTTLDGLTARQNAAKIGTRIALDCEHCTVEGTAAYAADSEPRKIAAWGQLTAVAGLGLVLDALEWTPLGLAAWENQSYQDISPAVFRKADGTVIAVHSAALCRHGEIDGLTITAAAAGARLSPYFAALSADYLDPTDPTTTLMKPHPALIALLSALGVSLSAEADETAIELALKDAAAKVDAMPKPEAMSAIVGRVEAIEQSAQEREISAIVAAATADGKVIPLSAETLKITPLTAIREMVAALKPTVPLGRKTPTGEGIETTQVDAFTAEQEEIFAKFGLKPSDIVTAA